MILTPEGLVLEINQRLLAAAQVWREEVVGKPFTDFPSWSSAPFAQRQLRAAIVQASGGETARFEARIRSQPGRYRDVALTITSHLDANQQVEYLIYVGWDITERKHAENELRVLAEMLPQFIWITRPDGFLKGWNQQYADYFQATPEQLQGSGWRQFLHPEEYDQVLSVRRHSLGSKQVNPMKLPTV